MAIVIIRDGDIIVTSLTLNDSAPRRGGAGKACAKEHTAAVLSPRIHVEAAADAPTSRKNSASTRARANVCVGDFRAIQK